MKIKHLFLLSLLTLLTFSCKDNNSSFVQVKSIETEIYNAILSYRQSNELSGPFVHQFLMVEEAQLYSYKMAQGLVAMGTQGLDEHWERLDEKYTFYNQAGLVLKTDSRDADQILKGLVESPEIDSVILADLTQCGVGVEVDTDGNNFITILLAKADS